MFVLGTAGHIDHGKSVLVHALTGIDPDRLREEKERGMTIDLGFAWMALPSGQEVGIVDVPGHEHFIKNMLAGVGGIDLALLIVAANEGVMPQTREHLAILDLLDIKRGVVALTKKDLVDDEWLELVRAEVEELLAPTSLAESPIVAVSAVNGDGMSELISAIDEILTLLEPKKDTGRPRIAIDRVFTIAGSGTVITGTLIDGSLTVGQEIEIVPAGLKSRLRGLQTHKHRIETAVPGSRVAANIVGIATTQIQRGQVLTSPGWLKPTTVVAAELRIIPEQKRRLKHNANVSFHTGSAETLAKVRLLDKDEIQPGETALIQISLSEPVAVVKGDRFIIRSTVDTLGGGEIIEPHARRYRRFRQNVIDNLIAKEQGTADEVVMAVLEGGKYLGLLELQAQCDLPAEDIQTAVESLIEQGMVIDVGQGQQRFFVAMAGWQRLTAQVTSVLMEYHRKFPARPGMPRVELDSRIKIGAQAQAVMKRLADDSVIAVEGAVIRLPDHKVQLTREQQAKVDTFLNSLEKNAYSPPSELIPESDLLNLLIEQEKVVRISEDVVFSTSAYEEMVSRIKAHLTEKGKVTLAEVRDMFQTSRKYALPLLEHLDRIKVTRRMGDDRVLV